MATRKGDYLCIRANRVEYADFRSFCDKKGISVATALRYFMRRSIDEKKLPFNKKELYLLQSKDNNGTAPIRVSLRIQDAEERNAFKKICDKHNASMAGAVKLFFRKCVENGEFPFDLKDF